MPSAPTAPISCGCSRRWTSGRSPRRRCATPSSSWKPIARWTSTPWWGGARRERRVNEGAAGAAARPIAPGFEPWEYLGYTRRQYRRTRELDAFLRRVAAPDLDLSGLGLRLRFLSGGMSPAARLAGGKVLPERSGDYLGLRLVEDYLPERAAASTVRAAAAVLQPVEGRIIGIQTACASEIHGASCRA